MDASEAFEVIVEKLSRIEKLLEREYAFVDYLISVLVRFYAENVEHEKVARFLRALLELRRLGVTDDISIHIVEVLATKGPLNVSEVTRELRRIRGKASRQTVGQRLEQLEKLGVVKRVKHGKGRVYDLNV